ncbi:5639_t:CDS:1 [Funneliformis mosseae]|uniref:5639_t:CDS:1 n=1 Tax=Funneliformis mosseae TaxID=27381 RepID=A0A9N8WK31_FUNMO|nr:5639_t:CDS:1 [Funneliformis mosseae]
MPEERKSSIELSSLPDETLYEIFRYIKKDLPTLYSCLRVNRLFCKHVIPFLWMNPMPNIYTSVEIGVYIYFFDQREKYELEQHHGLKLQEIPCPLFNYEKHLTVLNLRGIRHAVYYWLKNYHISKNPFFDECIDFSENSTIDFIERALLKLILKNAKKIKHLILDLSRRYGDIPDVDIFTNEEYPGIRNISKFSFINDSDRNLPNVQNLLDVLPTLCTSIEKLRFHELIFLNGDYELKLENLIKNQRGLISFDFTRGYINGSKFITALRNQSASLKRLVLSRNTFDEFTYRSLERLVKLEYLEIDAAYPIEFILIPLSKANLKLKYFKGRFIEEDYGLKESIIKSSKFTLKELYLYVYIPIIVNRSPLHEICPNLTHLSIELYIHDNISEHHTVFLNYINKLKELTHISIKFSCASNNNVLDDLVNLDLPSLKFISYEFDDYFLRSLKSWVDHFSTRFNKITFYYCENLEFEQIILLGDYAKKRDYLTIIPYEYEDGFKFVAMNQLDSY